MALNEYQSSFQGIPVSYWRGGAGFPILMLHGSGPGASSLANWRLVLEPLAERYEIFAMDLIGFGKSGRKPKQPYFDLDLWVAQCRHMLAQMAGSEFGVIGQSLSGMLALRLAAGEQQIAKVLTTGTMGAGFSVNDDLRRGWTLPKTREEFRRALESLVHDSAAVTDDQLEWRMRSLIAGGTGDYFEAMFADDRQKYVDLTILNSSELKQIRSEVVMVHGRNDKPVPAEATSVPMSRAIPNADLVILSNCGHLPAVERPEALLGIARMLFG